MSEKQKTLSTWSIIDENRVKNLISADKIFIDKEVKTKYQAVVNATDLLPDYVVKIGDIYDPKTKQLSHPS